MNSLRKVGFVGIGRMGYAMAGHLAKAGFEVTVADANPEAVAGFVAEHGGRAADSLADLARSSDAVITMLPNSKIVAAVVMGDGTDDGDSGGDCLADGLRAGTVVIDCSTSNPVDTRRLGDWLRERGVGMLDAPVAGGMVFAVEGTLDVTVGGEAALVERCRGLFEAFGQSVFHCGALGSGHALKALNNFVNASALLTAIEALSLGRRFGLDVETMVDAMTAAATGRNHPLPKKVVAHVLTRRFATGMDLGLIAKDTGITVDMARDMGAYAPVAELFSSLLSEAADTLGASEDQTCVAKQWEDKNKVTLTFDKP